MKTQVLNIEWVKGKYTQFRIEDPNGDVHVVGFDYIPEEILDQYSKALAVFTDMFSEQSQNNNYFGFITCQFVVNGLWMPISCGIDKNRERERIGERIKQLRQEKGIDAKTLAMRADITPANLCRIEQGKYSPGLDILVKIATALDAKIDFVPEIK